VDNSADSVLFKEDLLNIARTTLSSKLLNVEKDHFANLAVEAVLRLKGSGNLDHIQVRVCLGWIVCLLRAEKVIFQLQMVWRTLLLDHSVLDGSSGSVCTL